MVAEALDVGGVHVGVVIDRGEEHGGFDDIVQCRSFGFQETRHVCQRLTDLSIEAIDELTVEQAKLSRHVEGVSSANDGGVRTKRSRHGDSVARYDRAMAGPILILIALLLFFPINIMMSGAVLSAIVGGVTKSKVDSNFEGTEDLVISEANPYNGPEATTNQ